MKESKRAHRFSVTLSFAPKRSSDRTFSSDRKVLSDECSGAKLRVTENRCVLFDFFNCIYSALLLQHWALYAKVDSTPTFICVYIYIFCFFFFFFLREADILSWTNDESSVVTSSVPRASHDEVWNSATSCCSWWLARGIYGISNSCSLRAIVKPPYVE